LPSGDHLPPLYERVWEVQECATELPFNEHCGV
jgi:hypothetical protein